MRKKRRNEQKRIKLRSSTRAFYVVIALVLFAVSSNGILQEIIKKDEPKIKKEIYSYTNQSKTTYKINVKDNKFIEEDTLPMGQTYITELIDSMDLDIKYDYKGSKDVNVKYKYDITATIGASYTDSGKEYKVWNKKYTLLETKEGETNGDIKIDEAVNVNLAKYNREVNDFKQTMGMALDAYLNVQLNITTIAKVNGKEANNKYSSDLKIRLGSKITNIEKEDEDIKVGHIEEENTNRVSMNMFRVVVDIVVLIGSMYAIYYVATKTKVTRNIKNEYKLELNRILKSCQDKIVMVSKQIEVEDANTIEVKDFGELIKLSEELYKPILYWNSDNEQEAWFCVISSSVTYRFILKKY